MAAHILSNTILTEECTTPGPLAHFFVCKHENSCLIHAVFAVNMSKQHTIEINRDVSQIPDSLVEDWNVIAANLRFL